MRRHNRHNHRLKSHGHPPLFQRSSTAPTAPSARRAPSATRLDALLQFPSPPNPPTFREEPKEYKPNQRNFHRKQDFPQNCGKPSTEMSLFFFCGSSHSCLPSNIAHHPHQAHQHYKTLTKQCVSVRDVREVGAVRLVREEEE